MVCNGLATPPTKRKQQQQSKKQQEVASPEQKQPEKKDGNKPTKPEVQVEAASPLPAQANSVVQPSPTPPHTRCRTLSSDEQCFEELRKKHEAIFANQQQQQQQPITKAQPERAPEPPKTLSDVRSALLTVQPAAPEPDDRIDPHYREGINQLVMELMPGVALDEDVPVPRQRQKSSFHKELQKLQRANAAVVAAGPSTTTEPKMEVIRTPSVKSSQAEKRQGSEEKMQIRLERSTQIKEQYVKKGSAVLPSSVASAAGQSASSAAKGKSFVMPNVPADIDRHRGILSRDAEMKVKEVASKRTEVDEFEDLLEKIGDDVTATGDIDLDELLAEEEKPKPPKAPTVEKRTVEKKVDNLPVGNKQGPTKQEPSGPSYSNSKRSVESTASVSTATSSSGSTKTTASRGISEAKLNETISQLTDKLQQSRVKAAKEQDHSKDAFAALFSATDASQTELDLFEELCKREEPEPKQNRSDLVDSSTNAKPAAVMPDVISSTKKPEPKPLQILDHMESLKKTAVMPLVPPPQTIQVYTLHTSADGEQPVQPQPSTQGMSGDYAHILKDITSGLVGADFAAPVVYEPPAPARRDRTDFQAYKQLLEEKASREEPIPVPPAGPPESQPQRPLRRQKKLDRTETSTSPIPTAARAAGRAAFDNSLCIDPWRARKSASIENVAIEQVFVKQNDAVVDTFFVVPDSRQRQPSASSKLRRSKSYDRLAVPGSGQRRGSLKQKQSLDELRDFGYDVEPSVRSRHLVVELGGFEHLSFRRLPAQHRCTYFAALSGPPAEEAETAAAAPTALGNSLWN